MANKGLRPERPIDERLTMDAIAGDRASSPRETGEGQHLVRPILPERKSGYRLLFDRRALIRPEMKARHPRHAGSAAFQNAASGWITPDPAPPIHGRHRIGRERSPVQRDRTNTKNLHEKRQHQRPTR